MTELLDDLKQIIVAGSAGQDRSQQVAIGPSEVGDPCLRKLAFKLMGAPKVSGYNDPLPSVVGTGAHLMLEQFARDQNRRLDRIRWLPETRVTIREGLSGTCDLVDLDTKTVIDWKGLALDTAIPTPTGWSTIERLTVGDQVIGSDGLPCRVTAKSPVFERDCYRIVFDDGASVTADNVHLWNVTTGSGAREKARTVSTEQLFEMVERFGQKVRVANTAPLTLPDMPLLIGPYTLGAWLGDGDSDAGRISKPEPEIFDHIGAEGYDVGPWQKVNGVPMRRAVRGLTAGLRLEQLLGDKRIPEPYLRGSRWQRLSLLQGLMDTDGTWNKVRSQAVFSTSRKDLAQQVVELISSLGWKPRLWELTKRGFGLTTTAYDVTFVPFGYNPFRLQRKAELVRLEGTVRSRRRLIASVTRTLTVPTQCISVDSADETFLCTRAMIPTHNCPGHSRIAHYRSHGPSDVYRRQAHLYGRGMRNMGIPISTVAICFLPRGGELKHAYLWSEPYDDGVVDETLARLDSVTAMLYDLDVERHPENYRQIPATPEACFLCDYFQRPASGLTCDGGKPDAITRLSA